MTRRLNPDGWTDSDALIARMRELGMVASGWVCPTCDLTLRKWTPEGEIIDTPICYGPDHPDIDMEAWDGTKRKATVSSGRVRKEVEPL